MRCVTRRVVHSGEAGRGADKKGKEETLKTFLVTVAIVCVFALASWPLTHSFAQCGPGVKVGGSDPSLGMKLGMGSQPLYDSTKVERISGIVESTDKIVPGEGINAMVQLMLKAEKETVAAQLAPEWYISKSGMKLEAEDTVEGKGCRALLAGRPAYLYPIDPALCSGIFRRVDAETILPIKNECIFLVAPFVYRREAVSPVRLFGRK